MTGLTQNTEMGETHLIIGTMCLHIIKQATR